MQTDVIEPFASTLLAREPKRPPARHRTALLLSLVCAALLTVASVDGGTFWIDEGFSAWMACHRTFSGLLHSIGTGDGQDMQAAFYYVYLWLWRNLFGYSEYALRIANIPFGFLFCASLAYASTRLWGKPAAWLWLCLSPFFASFLNETRTYLPLMACTAACLSAFLVHAFAPATNLQSKERRLLPWLCLGSLLLAFAFDILALFVGPALLVLAWFGVRPASHEVHAPSPVRWKAFFAVWRTPLLVFAPAFLALGAFDVWAITHGTDYSNLTPFRPAHLALIAYEFAGFGGFGPGRNILRLPQATHALVQHWPSLLAGFTGLSAACAAAFCGRLFDRRLLLALSAATLASCASLVAAGVFLHERFLPRHAAGLHPLVLFLAMALVSRPSGPADRSRKLWLAAALAAFALTWAVSDMRLRLLPEYQKEDYRQAASLAIAESRRLHADIAWSADNFTGFYYGLQLREFKPSPPPSAAHFAPGDSRFFLSAAEVERRVSWPTRAPAYIASNLSPAVLESFLRQHRLSHTPVVLALSKPDLYDQQQVLTNLLGRLRLQPLRQLNGFVIYIVP